MTIATTLFLSQVDNILAADDDELSEAARRKQIEAAAEWYSRDMPDIVTTDVTGDGGNYYAITTSLTSWSEGFSRIMAIEYPAPTVASDEAPVYLDNDDWDDDYWASGVRYFYLPNHAPAATESIRVRYTAPYTESAGAYDIPPAHFFAVCHLAAGLCCRAIAVKYSRTADSTISVDSVDHLSRAQQFRERADELIRQYREQLNIREDEGGQPAGQFIDWDTRPTEQRYWLYH